MISALVRVSAWRSDRAVASRDPWREVTRLFPGSRGMMRPADDDVRVAEIFGADDGHVRPHGGIHLNHTRFVPSSTSTT